MNFILPLAKRADDKLVGHVAFLLHLEQIAITQTTMSRRQSALVSSLGNKKCTRGGTKNSSDGDGWIADASFVL